jgi:hypothetical protein
MFPHHSIQMPLDCCAAYSWITTFSYRTVKFTERLGQVNPILIKISPKPFSLSKKYRILFHYEIEYDISVIVSIVSGRICVLLKTSLLSLLYFFIFSMSSKSKLIAVSEKTYHDLAEMGTLEDSFNSVIERMIQKQKAAASGLTLAGTG